MKIDREKYKVSVAMATYNGEKYVEQQIKSILVNLTDKDELIISDDNSSDNTLGIISDLMAMDSRIKLYSNNGKGVKQNFQNAILHCKNKYIFLSDQDDVWENNKVDIVLKYFIETGKKIILHDAGLIDAEGNSLGKTVYEYRNSKKGYIKNLYKNSYMGCCMAIDTDILNQVIPIPDKVDMHDSWIGLIGDLHKWVLVIPDVLIKYRRHGNNVTEMDTHQSVLKMIKKRWYYLVFTLKRVVI